MSWGPVASQLCLLSQLKERSVGDKVRFLGCVISYDTSTACLALAHMYPPGTDETVLVDIELVLETIQPGLTQVGHWVNVVGYIVEGKKSGTQKRGSVRKEVHHQRDRVSPVDFWLKRKLHHPVTTDDGTNSGSGDCPELIAHAAAERLRVGATYLDRAEILATACEPSTSGKSGRSHRRHEGGLWLEHGQEALTATYTCCLFTLLCSVCLEAHGLSVSLKLFPAHHIRGRLLAFTDPRRIACETARHSRGPA
ncbi:hypothetical protein MKX08_000538 [Trichoderma sp. CBMAI-0020]|nr:hypothetical protein MKX08_000538 [Trichoderma sp. CBMAI-0020]